jgi:hypothetical protein
VRQCSGWPDCELRDLSIERPADCGAPPWAPDRRLVETWLSGRFFAKVNWALSLGSSVGRLRIPAARPRVSKMRRNRLAPEIGRSDFGADCWLLCVP